jgi:hypothetical protein
MGGWKDDAPAAAPVSPARRIEGRRSFSSRSSIGGGGNGNGDSWKDAIKPVKASAAKGQNSNDALQVAVGKFLDNTLGGFPALGDTTAKEVASDVLLLMRAVNRPHQGSGGRRRGWIPRYHFSPPRHFLPSQNTFS